MCPSLLVVLQVVNYSESRTAEEICESSSKMITFIDLAGHHKYLKTTVFGLTSYCPNFAMLMVSANTGIGEQNRSKQIKYWFPIPCDTPQRPLLGTHELSPRT